MPGYVIADAPTRRPGNGWAINEDGTGAKAQEENGCETFGSLYFIPVTRIKPQNIRPYHHSKSSIGQQKSFFRLLHRPVKAHRQEVAKKIREPHRWQ